MFSWLFSDPLEVGTPAPDFTLPDDAGHRITLSALKGKRVVLVFYPADDTPGCTKQLCEFRDDWADARAAGVEVFGVNPGSAKSHGKFRQKFKLPFPLLVDESQKVAQMYNAHGLMVKRTVYLVGKDGLVKFARRGAPSPDEVLKAG